MTDKSPQAEGMLRRDAKRLLAIGHCPWDTEVEEGDALPEPHCHANSDGDCSFAYCPQTLLKLATQTPAPATPRDGKPMLYAIQDAKGNWKDGESCVFGDEASCRDAVDSLNDDLPEDSTEKYTVVPLYRAAPPAPQGQSHLTVEDHRQALECSTQTGNRFACEECGADGIDLNEKQLMEALNNIQKEKRAALSAIPEGGAVCRHEFKGGADGYCQKCLRSVL